MVGMNSHSLVNLVYWRSLYYQSKQKQVYREKFRNNCAFFVLGDLPSDYEGSLEIRVKGPECPSKLFRKFR